MKLLISEADHPHFTYRLPSGYQSIWYWPTPDDAYDAAVAIQPDGASCVIVDGNGKVVEYELGNPVTAGPEVC